MTEAVGGVWSVTITVRVTGVAWFPTASILLYVSVYVPRIVRSTDPERVKVASRVEPDAS